MNYDEEFCNKLKENDTKIEELNKEIIDLKNKLNSRSIFRWF